jgi:hypothetical protein
MVTVKLQKRDNLKKIFAQVGIFYIALIIVIILYFIGLPYCTVTKTSWMMMSGIKTAESEYLLGTVCLDSHENKLTTAPYFLQGKNIIIYKNLGKSNILKKIDLPGDLTDYGYDSINGYLYFAVDNDGDRRLIVYQYQNYNFSLISNTRTEYTHLNYHFSKPGRESNDDTITLVSADCKSIQLFKPIHNVYYELKHSKPFKVTKRGINQVFDGDRIFNIYTPDVSEARFDYSSIAFDSSMLDLRKPLEFGNGWFYNNGYLITFDVKLYKALSLTQIGDVIDIDSFESNKASDDISAGYTYITRDGIYKCDWKTKTPLLQGNNITKDNFVYGCELDFELYAMTEGPNTKIIAIKYGNKFGNKEIEELGITPGSFQGADVVGGYIYAYTTQGVFKNYYPHLKYLESRHSN